MLREVKHIVLFMLMFFMVLVMFSCIPKSTIMTLNSLGVDNISVRVLLGKERRFRLLSSGSLIFANGVPFNKEVQVELFKSNIIVGGISFGKSVEVYSDESIIFNGLEYSGFFRLVVGGDEILVVNVVGLEEYLESVVPSEVPALWPMEVLKAQAIASRTYALRKILENKDKEYDVVASYKSQVYSGTIKQHPRTRQAVRETRGMVMTHNGEVIFAFFHANSGGLTESAEIIGSRSFPYLRPFVDKFSRNTFRSFWRTSIPKAEFLRRIFGTENVRLVEIEIPSRTSAGSVREVKVVASGGGRDFSRVISINEFRETFPLVLSAKFEVDVEGEAVVFRGYGWGHGVGMSQWGAKEMASQGYSYREILRYYYKDVDIVRLY